MNWVKFKAQTQLNKKCSAVKHTKIKGVPKLDDANDAGKNSIKGFFCRKSLHGRLPTLVVLQVGRILPPAL